MNSFNLPRASAKYLKWLMAAVAAIWIVQTDCKAEETKRDDIKNVSCLDTNFEACAALAHRQFLMGDKPMAAENFQKACDGGFKAACLRISSIYFMGWGIQKSTIKALAYANKACPELAVACDMVMTLMDGFNSNDSEKIQKQFSSAVNDCRDVSRFACRKLKAIKVLTEY